MRLSNIALGIVLLTGQAAIAQESPFSQTPYPGPTARPELYATLGDIMGLTQLRHEKLWHAGRAKNWDLAAYEIQQLRSTLVRSATLYLNIPIELVITADAPLEELLKAVKARDDKAFASAYGQLTAACNTCHQAGGVGFIRMIVPRTSSMTNQDFNPQGR
jgi:cytochrome c553